MDVYPVDLTINGETTRYCRVLVHNGEAHAFTSTEHGAPDTVRRVARAALTETVPAGRNVWQLATEDGDWDLVKLSDCGCHYPLKRMTAPVLVALVLLEVA